MKPLTLDQLKIAQQSGGIADVTLTADGGEFYVGVRTRSGDDAVLVKTRSRMPRGFVDPRKAIALLHSLGIVSVTLDTARWTQEQPAGAVKRRPDRAEAMRRTHEAVEHDNWFRSEVERGLAEIEGEGAELISHESVEALWRARRASLGRSAGGRET